MSDDTNTNQDENIAAVDAVADMQEENVVPAEEAGTADVTEATDENAERVEAVEEDKEIKEEDQTEADSSGAEASQNDETSTEEAQHDETPVEEDVDQPDTTGTLNTSDEAKAGKWYVVHTYSGHENKVATALKQRVESEHLEHKIFDVLVPTQDKIEIRSGKKETVKEKIFPGYILVKMILDDDSWLAVRTTQGVTSFVGMGNKPTPIPEYEVRTIVKFMTQEAAPTFKDVFLVSDTVKIVDGPFADFIGKVDAVDKDRGKVKVLVSIFGRETPVELDFLQVQKL